MISADVAAFLPLYQAVISHLPQAPDLSTIQQRQPLPEDWPVMLVSIHTGRGGYLETIEITDGTHTAHCTTTIPDVANRLVSLDAGTVIHILGGETRYSDQHRCYVLDIENVCTLKEYDTITKQRAAADAERAEHQRQWLEETYFSNDTADTDSAGS
jgi:hypothetical protein